MMAVAAVGFGLGFAHAGNVKVDFDGRTAKGFNVAEAMQAAYSNQNTSLNNIQPSPVPENELTAGQMTDIDNVDWTAVLQNIQAGGTDYCASVVTGPWWIGCVLSLAPGAKSGVDSLPVRHDYLEVGGSGKKQLGIYYVLQADLRKMVLAYFHERQAVTPEIIGIISDSKNKIIYDSEGVYVFNKKMLVVVTDKEFINKVLALQNAVALCGDTREPVSVILAGAGIAIGCMSNPNCWNAVGDSVSGVSQWWHSHDGQSDYVLDQE